MTKVAVLSFRLYTHPLHLIIDNMRQEPVIFKECPRDRGDLVYEKDRYGDYWDCLQCGHHYYSGRNGTPILNSSYSNRQPSLLRKGSRERVGGYHLT